MLERGRVVALIAAAPASMEKSLVEQCLDAEAKNVALRQKLGQLKGEISDVPSDKINKETEGKLRAIELMKTELALKQSMESKELMVKRLQEEIHAEQMEDRAIKAAIHEARNVGQPVWETTGYGTITYRDPFPTGLPKRTPTGGFFSG